MSSKEFDVFLSDPHNIFSLHTHETTYLDSFSIALDITIALIILKRLDLLALSLAGSCN
jgi:hypothetical protein